MMKPPEVLIGYKDLLELLEASAKVRSFQVEIDQLKAQNAALRLQFTELMERVSDLQHNH